MDKQNKMCLALRQGLGNNDPANQSSNSRLSAWESCPGPFWLLFLLSHICHLIYMHQINTNCHIWARKGRCLTFLIILRLWVGRNENSKFLPYFSISSLPHLFFFCFSFDSLLESVNFPSLAISH